MDERSLNELLECSVCLDRLDASSKVLPCQHTFCRRCLDEIVSTKKELRCPECRLLVEFRVEDLPTNILLIRLLEGIKTAAAKSGTGTPTSGSAGASVTNSPCHAAGNARTTTSTKSSPSHKVNPQPCARALYNYEAKEPGDLSFKKGDLIVLKKQVDENWFHGELANNNGFFPATYVQIVTPLPQQDVPRCKALYDFMLDNQREEKDCLTFHKDEAITVIRRVDDNWVEGCLGDRIGIFPIAFVEMNDAAKWLLNSQQMSIPSSSHQAAIVHHSHRLGGGVLVSAARINSGITTTTSQPPSTSSVTTVTSRTTVSAPTFINSSTSANVSTSTSTSSGIVGALVSGDLLNSAIDHCLSLITSNIHSTSRMSGTSIMSPSTARPSTAAASSQVNVPRRMSQHNRQHQQHKRHSFNGEASQNNTLSSSSDSTQRHSLELLSSSSSSSESPTLMCDVSTQSTLTISKTSVTSAQTTQTTTTSKSGSKQASRASLSMPLPSIYTAMYSYKPQKSDELELLKGHYYTVTERCQDGWYKGASLHSGQLGVFPGNYVQFIKLSPSKSTAPSRIPGSSQSDQHQHGVAAAAGDAGISSLEEDASEATNAGQKSHISLNRHHSFPKSLPLGLSALVKMRDKTQVPRVNVPCTVSEQVADGGESVLPSAAANSETSRPCDTNKAIVTSSSDVAQAAQLLAAACDKKMTDSQSPRSSRRDRNHRHHRHRHSNVPVTVEAASSSLSPIASSSHSQRKSSRLVPTSEAPVLGRAATRHNSHKADHLLSGGNHKAAVISSSSHKEAGAYPDVTKQVQGSVISGAMSSHKQGISSKSSKGHSSRVASSAKSEGRSQSGNGRSQGRSQQSGRSHGVPVACFSSSMSAASSVVPPNVVIGATGTSTSSTQVDAKDKKEKREKEKTSLIKKLTSSSLAPSRRKARTPPPESLTDRSTGGCGSSGVLDDLPLSKTSSVPVDSEAGPSCKHSSRRTSAYTHKKSGSLDSAQVLIDDDEAPPYAAATGVTAVQDVVNCARQSNKVKLPTRDRYRCVLPYPPQSDLELELKAGDIVYVSKKRDDGWYKGILQRNGKSGLFPANFVEAF